MLAGTDWSREEGAEPAAAAASVARILFAVTCQSLADAPPSCAAPSTHQKIINIIDGSTMYRVNIDISTITSYHRFRSWPQSALIRAEIEK